MADKRFRGLTLTRRIDESVVIVAGGMRIVVAVTKVSRNCVELTFDAPDEVTVNREEVQKRIDREVRKTDCKK